MSTNELYLNWQIQENTLQWYRSIGLALQAVLLALSGVVATILYGIIQGHPPNYVAGSLLSFVLFVLVILGAYSAWIFDGIVRHRGRIVTMYQHTLALAEAGRLARELGVEPNDPIPYFAASQFAECKSEADFAGRFPEMPTTFWRFFRAKYLDETHHHKTRRRLRAIFRVYIIIAWAGLACFLVFVLVSLLGVVNLLN